MKQQLKVILFIVLIFVLIPNKDIYGQYDDRYSKWMANSIMKRSPNGYGSWDYVTGTVLKGFQELWLSTGDSIYYDYIKTTVDDVVNSDGTISGYDRTDYNIDEIKEGCALLFLYEHTGDTIYSTAAGHLRQQLAEHPRTSEGGFWHKKVYTSQMWLDGLYMGSPFYAQYNKVFNDTQYFSDVVKQIVLMDKHAYDSATGLYFHGWDESEAQTWADPVTGCSPSFWGRAIGWYAMAMVDVLDFLPADHTGRDSIIDILQRLSEGMANHQDTATGLWYQVVDKGDSVDNYLESSVSCMMVYALAKAVRLGYIDHSYKNVAKKAFNGIIDEFITITSSNNTINLTKTCATAGLGPTRDGTYHYYIYETYYRTNDGKGLGPFILASLEIENILPAPSNLALDTITDDSVVISWNDNSPDEMGFLLYRTDTADNITTIVLDSNITQYADTSIAPFTTYYYRLCAYNDTDTSLFSNTLSVATFGENGEPYPAHSPFPANNQVNLATSITLSWIAGTGAISHDVYFGISNPPPFIGNQDEIGFNPGTLGIDTTYYWRINEVNASGVTQGELWQFKTTSGVGTEWGIKKLDNEIGHVNIYPNPFTDYLTLSFSLQNNAKIMIDLYTCQGQLAYQNDAGVLVKGNHFIKFDTPGLFIGTYILKISMNDEYQYIKLIKLQ